jgi:ribosome assembly protein YihI (activator of Der GTPase)|tara:strand:+ start:3113 stop:3358 length:246 start_codon:yes stop_codon:yes gene_type:complete
VKIGLKIRSGGIMGEMDKELEKLAMKDLSENWTEDQKWVDYAEEATDRISEAIIEKYGVDEDDIDVQNIYEALLDTWSDYF